jgi:hypothetical protein
MVIKASAQRVIVRTPWLLALQRAKPDGGFIEVRQAEAQLDGRSGRRGRAEPTLRWGDRSLPTSCTKMGPHGPARGPGVTVEGNVGSTLTIRFNSAARVGLPRQGRQLVHPHRHRRLEQHEGSWAGVPERGSVCGAIYRDLQRCRGSIRPSTILVAWQLTSAGRFSPEEGPARALGTLRGGWRSTVVPAGCLKSLSRFSMSRKL